MFSVKDTNTVNGIATSNVGARDTRATNHACSKTPATETASENEPHGVADIANNHPPQPSDPTHPTTKQSPATTDLLRD